MVVKDTTVVQKVPRNVSQAESDLQVCVQKLSRTLIPLPKYLTENPLRALKSLVTALRHHPAACLVDLAKWYLKI